MDLKPLNIFLTVADLASFTRAAEKLRMAQPAVSIAVRKLEEELGVPLFNRKDRSVTLTAEGAVFRQHARAILGEVQTARRAVEEMRELARGEVSVGIPTMLGSYYFPDLIIEFIRRHPQLQFSVKEHGTRTLQKMIAEGELDLGIVVTENIPETLEVRPFLQQEMVVCVPPRHPFARQPHVTFAEFARESLVLFKEGYFQREVIARVGGKAGLAPRITFETNLLPLIKQAVRKGIGITTLLEMVFADDPELVAVKFEPSIRFELGIAWKKNAFLSQANRRFVDFLLAWEERRAVSSRPERSESD